MDGMILTATRSTNVILVSTFWGGYSVEAEQRRQREGRTR